MSDWNDCKKILCVRLDNRGDVLMSSPAFRALKESFGCRISLLTSSMAADIVPFIPEIDQTFIFDAPWVKINKLTETDSCYKIIETLKSYQFDAAVIFTVFSQNPLPAALLLYLAGIPRRLAYCRENPYNLLTHWIPDTEPYDFIQHQVVRDIRLVEFVGAKSVDNRLKLQLTKNVWPDVDKKLKSLMVKTADPWIVVHAGVSEPKRQYPLPLWGETIKKIVKTLNYQVLLTGSMKEKPLIEEIKKGVNGKVFNVAGLFSLEEFIYLIKYAPLVVSVNTVTIHIAAATRTPQIVLYALSNPQHLPWMAKGKVLPFAIPQKERSRNAILQFVQKNYFPESVAMVMPDDILRSIRDVIGGSDLFIPEIISFDIGQKMF